MTGARAFALIFLMDCGVRNNNSALCAVKKIKYKNLSTRVGLHYHPFTAVSSTMPCSVPLIYFVVVHFRHLLHWMPSRNARLYQRGATIAPAIATKWRPRGGLACRLWKTAEALHKMLAVQRY